MKKEILGSWWNQREQGGCFCGLHESQVSWNTTAIRHPLPGTKPAGTWCPIAWWGWILLFVCAVWKCKKCSSSVGKGRNHPKCAAVDGSLTSSFTDVKGLFPHFLEDGECFGVVMMFSLLCFFLREPLGIMWDFEERAGKPPPSFTHSSSHMWQIHACSTSRFYLLTKFYFPSVSVYIA